MILVNLNFSKFIFSISIYKDLFSECNSIFRHLDFISAFQMIPCNFRHSVFLKAGSYVFINTWNTEFYVPLLLRQNKSRYKIWRWIELDCSYEWKQPTNKKNWPMAWFWCRYDYILILSIFIEVCFFQATMSPYKVDTLTFVDTKGKSWGSAICHQWQNFYLRISYWFKYRATYILLKQT